MVRLSSVSMVLLWLHALCAAMQDANAAYFHWPTRVGRLWHVSEGRRIHRPAKDPVARALENALTPANLELHGTELWHALSRSSQAFSLTDAFRPFERVEGDSHMLVVRVLPNPPDDDGYLSVNYLVFLDRGEVFARRLVDNKTGGFSAGMEQAQWRRHGNLLFGLGSSTAAGGFVWGGLQIFQLHGDRVTKRQSIWFPWYSDASFLSPRSADVRAIAGAYNFVCLQFRKTSPRLTRVNVYRFSGGRYRLVVSRIEHDEVWVLDRLIWSILSRRPSEVRRFVPNERVRNRLLPCLTAALHHGHRLVVGGDRLSLDDPAVPWLSFGFAGGEPYVKWLSRKDKNDDEG